MTRTCVIPFCTTGRKVKGKIVSPGSSLHQIPKNPELLKKWEEELDLKLKRCQYVCSLHFNPKDIFSSEQIIINGEIIVVEKDVARLKSGAVPSRNLHGTKTSCQPTDICEASTESPPPTDTDDDDLEASTISSTCLLIHANASDVKLPSSLWGIHTEPEGKFVAFTYYSPESRTVEKSVLFEASRSPLITLTGGYTYRDRDVVTIGDLELFLEELDSKRICSGAYVTASRHYSPKCDGFVDQGKSRKENQCSNCENEYYKISCATIKTEMT